MSGGVRPAVSAQLEDGFDFHGDVAGERAHADGAARADAVVGAPDFGEEFGTAVDDFRVFTMPSTLMTRATRSRLPSCAQSVARIARPTCRAAALPASRSRSRPTTPVITVLSARSGPWPET